MVVALCFLSTAAELSAASANPSETPAPPESLSIGGAAIKWNSSPVISACHAFGSWNWVRRSACAVTEYYSGFPVQKREREGRAISEGKGVLFGRTVVVDQTPLIRVGLSKFATDSSLLDDWVMTHEMVISRSPRCQTSITGSRKESPPTSSRSGAHRSAIFRRDSLARTRGRPSERIAGAQRIEAWTTLTPGSHVLGGRAVLPDGGYRDPPAHQQSIRAPDALRGSSAPAATWNTTGRSREL